MTAEYAPSRARPRQVFRDPARDAEFHARGFTGMPLLSPEEADDLLARVAQLRPDDEYSGGGHARFHCSFLDSNRTYRRQVRTLCEEVFRPHVERHLAGYRIVTCNIYVKPPGTGKFAPHQNWPGLADLNDTTLTLWCPLQDVDGENGALQFIPGSHKLLPHVQGPRDLPYVHHIAAADLEPHLELFPLKAGEAVFFDESLIHGSPTNNSGESRFAVQVLCAPRDADSVYFFHVDDGRFELIRADSEFWLEAGAEMLARRQPEWESLGFVGNANRFVTLAEFEALLADGDRIRRRGLRLPDEPRRDGAQRAEDGIGG